MNTKQSQNKSRVLLSKISGRGLTTEAHILNDPGLLELFSWEVQRSARARLKDTLNLLVKQGDLSLGLIDYEKLYKITPAGHTKLILTQARQAALLHPTSWNQRWHFVSYQIPEAKKVARNQLLIELKRIGFKRYAPALWLYPYDVSKPIRQIAQHLGVNEMVDFMRADAISQDSLWRKKFKL